MEPWNRGRGAPIIAIMPSPDLPPGKVLEYRGFGQKRPPREACRVELRDDPARIVVVTARGGELVSRFEPSSVTITTGERRVAPSPPVVASGGIIATLIIAVFWLVVDVLLAMGVPAEAAEADAEGIEHHVSETTLKAFARFLRSHT